MKLYETLKKQLKKKSYFVTNNGELKKWVILNKAQNFDEELIGLLLENTELKDKFFKKIKDIMVFNQNLFVQFLEQKNYLNDSYTQYKNKIGLTIDGKYLKQRNEVALVWPFKDCILEGGQSREEETREEIFFNEVLAQDEITQLLEPKVLTNAILFDKDGKHAFSGFTRDAQLNKKRGLPENTITDNLIIKGNNLIALYSLKKEFSGKVKLIYIDPPYNTGKDGFKYNDRFNRATWLTFMQNRLTIAKQLLRDDGLIFISIDDNEYHYLKVLMDSVFNEINNIGTFVWRKKAGAGADSKRFFRQHEYIILYSKNIDSIQNLYQPLTDKQKKEYKNPDNDPRGPWAPTDLTAPAHDNDPKRIYKVVSPNGKVFERCWSYTKENMDNLIINNLVTFGNNGSKIPKRKRFLSEKKGLVPRSWIDDFLTSDGKKDISNLDRDLQFEYPKPVGLIKRFIEIGTNKYDIILDFHAGSGTTAHAVLQLNMEDDGNRQFILVEQMEYCKTLTVKRACQIISNNKKGSFYYFELKQHNQNFIDKIQKAKDTDQLLALWDQIKSVGFINYNIDIRNQKEQIKQFIKLNLTSQKKYLVEILDKNKLYVNLSSLDDRDFNISLSENKLTTNFYNIKNNNYVSSKKI